MPTLRSHSLASEAALPTDTGGQTTHIHEASHRLGSDVEAGTVIPVLNPLPSIDHDPEHALFPEMNARPRLTDAAAADPPASDTMMVAGGAGVASAALLTGKDMHGKEMSTTGYPALQDDVAHVDGSDHRLRLFLRSTPSPLL